METKMMTFETWVNCRVALRAQSVRYIELIRESVKNSNVYEIERDYFIDMAKYWSKKYKGVIISINELKEF